MAPTILLFFIIVALKDALPGECRFVLLDTIKYMEVQKDGTKKFKSCWYDACGFTATNLAPVEQTWARGKETEFHLFMNEQGNWQLKVDGQDVGFWPRDLLSGLRGGARVVIWGGKLTTTANTPSRSSTIGNGAYPTRRNPWDSSLMMMEVQGQDGSYTAPTKVQRVETTPDCYAIMDGGSGFFYGGTTGRCIR